MIDRREAISRGPYYIKVLIDALQVDEMSRLMGNFSRTVCVPAGSGRADSAIVVKYATIRFKEHGQCAYR